MADRTRSQEQKLFEIANEDGVIVVQLRGEIDQHTSRGLLSAVSEQIDQGISRVIFEMSGLDFIDSTGLSVIVDLHEQAARKGGKLVFAAPSDRILRILRVTRLDRYIDLHDDVTAAKKSFATPENST